MSEIVSTYKGQEEIVCNKIYDKLCEMGVGTEIDVSGLVSVCYGKRECVRTKKNIYWKFKKMIIEDFEQFDLLDRLERKCANNGYKLDFSKWNGAALGLPYNVSFIFKQNKWNKKTIQDRITNPKIRNLEKNQIFVFGSNLAGHHDGGAAYYACRDFGAVYGQGVGLQGQSYAIPTMQGGVKTIKPYVDSFVKFAATHTELDFLVTRVGCGIAGFTDGEIAPLFKKCVDLENVSLPEEWWKILESNKSPIGKLFEAVNYLHSKGYEQIRILPYMSSSGFDWRCIISTKNNFSNSDGLKLISDNKLKCFFYSSASNFNYFGNFEGDKCSVEELGNEILKKHYYLKKNGFGEDKEYIAWYLKILESVKDGNYPYAFTDSVSYEELGYLLSTNEKTHFDLPPVGSSTGTIFKYNKKGELECYDKETGKYIGKMITMGNYCVSDDEI